MATNLLATIPAIGLALFSSKAEEVKRDDLQYPTFTLEEVARHCQYDDCWIVIDQKIYDVTKFVREHPGGEEVILELGGGDATSAFSDKGHSKDAVDMLRHYFIGVLAVKPQTVTSRSD